MMTKAEIAELKEELTADYKRKLEALELVEQMLNQPHRSHSRVSSRGRVHTTRVRRGATIAVRIEQAFQRQPKWTIPALMSATGIKHRSSVWVTLNRLVKERRIRVSNQPSGRRPAEYMRLAQ